MSGGVFDITGVLAMFGAGVAVGGDGFATGLRALGFGLGFEIAGFVLRILTRFFAIQHKPHFDL